MSQPSSHAPRVLLFESDPTQSTLLAELLKLEGMQVEVVPEKRSALRRLKQRRYDLLLAGDAPGGASGLHLHQLARGEGVRLPTIVLTQPGSETEIAGHLSGLDDHLHKPVTEIELALARVRSVLARRLDAVRFDAEISGLLQIIRKSPGHRDEVESVKADLAGLRARMRRNKQVAIFLEDRTELELASDALRTAGMVPRPATDLADLLGTLADTDHPMVVVIEGTGPETAERISTLRRLDPQVEVVVCVHAARAAIALEAVRAGASDVFTVGSESWPHLVTRVRRALSRTGRRRVFDETCDILEATALRLGVQPTAAEAAATTAGGERRAGVRHPVDLHARLPGPASWVARVRDLSSTGLFLATDELPPLGARLEVELHSDAQVVPLGGEVVRSVQFRPDPDQRTGVGLRLDPWAAEALRPVLEAVAG